MANNYKNAGGVGKYAFDGAISSNLCIRNAFGIVLQSLNVSTDADTKNILDENGVTTGMILKDSKATYSLDGYVTNQDALPNVGDLLDMSLFFNVQYKTLDSTNKNGIVTKIDFKSTNEDLQQASIEVVYHPSLIVPSTQSAMTLEIPQEETQEELPLEY